METEVLIPKANTGFGNDSGAISIHSARTGRLPAYFSFDNVSYEITQYKSQILSWIGKGGKSQKLLLSNIFGLVKPGETLAIMGPSGSGKTTLLDVLADRKNSGKLTGDILLNGTKRNRVFKRLSGYVLQQDILIGHLSVREVLTFAAEFRLDRSVGKEERKRRVNSIIDELKLTKVADNIIGTDDIRGLSGGERKRVSIGIELITDPPLLLLDEPTTGLDSKTALSLMDALRDLAIAGNRTILFTIHQPRSNITKRFDKLLLLAEGKQLYFGDAAKALPFFESNGFICDSQTNPSDFYLDIIADDSQAVSKLHQSYLSLQQCRDTKEELQQLINIENRSGYAHSSLNGDYGAIPASAAAANFSKGYNLLLEPDKMLQSHHARQAEMNEISEYASSFFSQVYTLLKREVISNIRNIRLFWTQLFQAVALGIIMGSLWSNNKVDPTQGNTSVFFFVTTYLGMMCFMAAPHLISFRHIFFHERISGYYRVSSYVVSKTLVDIPFYSIVAIVFAAIVFAFAGLPYETMGFYLLICVLLVLTASSVITFIGSIAPAVEVAMVLATFINGMSMLFSGFFVININIPSYWKWMVQSSYIHHGFTGLFLNMYGEDSVETITLFSPNLPINRYESIWVLVIIAASFRVLTFISLSRKPSN